MADKQPHPEPQAGGSYIREADGSLTLVHRTEPVQGRAQASREALEARMGTASGDGIEASRKELEERTSDGTGIVMTPVPEGAAITGDGSGTALSPITHNDPEE